MEVTDYITRVHTRKRYNKKQEVRYEQQNKKNIWKK